MKGVSQIITAVILMGVAVSVAGIYSSWAPEFSERITSDAIDQASSDMRCQNAGLRIQDATYMEISGEISMNVANTGTITFEDEVTVYAIESSSNVGEYRINRFEAGDSQDIEFGVSSKPDIIMASSSDCPDVDGQTSHISVV